MKILVLSGQNDAANARHARTLARRSSSQALRSENLKKILLHALQFRAAEYPEKGLPRAILWSGRARRCKN